MSSSDAAPLTIILIQLCFYCGVWQFFFAGSLMRTLLKMAQSQAWYSTVNVRKGALASDGQKDIVLLGVLTVHHACSGGLMMAGAYLGNGLLWKHGALMEMGFEVMDLIANIRSVWPYEPGHVDPDVRLAFALHHMPGLLTLIPICLNGLNEHPSIQRLGAWLLFAASVSAAMGAFTYTRSFDKPEEMKQAAIAHNISVISFLYARFAVYPFEFETFYQTYKHRHDIHPYFPDSIWYGGHCLTVFNVLVGVKILQKSIRYFRRAFLNHHHLDLNDNAQAVLKQA